MKWSTKTEYVNIDTGEVLSKKHIQQGKFIIVKTTKNKYTKYGNDHIQRNITHHCKENNQLEMEFQTIPNNTIEKKKKH